MRKGQEKRPVPNHLAGTGDKTPIFCDPITRTRLEGVATLVSLERRDDVDGLNRWLVRFDSEPDQTYTRTVFVGEPVVGEPA